MDGIEKYIFGQSAYEEMADVIADVTKRVSQDQLDDIKLKANHLSETTTMSYQDAFAMVYNRWLKGDAE